MCVCVYMWAIEHFFKIDFREREEGRERERERKREHQFVVPLTDAFTGCFLYVSWLETEPATLAYWDNTLTNPARARVNFLPCMGLCNHHHNQEYTPPYTTKKECIIFGIRNNKN